ncbi:MAG TPA: hypothetical protein VF070_05245 [Streptosporangiaceae bacterium]
MIIAASLCPWPPVLARELTGRDPVIPELRKACTEATERLVGARPELIAVVGPADQTRRWDPGSRLDLSVFAPALGSGGTPALPPSVGLGALLLDQIGYRGPRILEAVSEHEEAAGCAELGAAIGGSAERVGLLVMGDGSARRSTQAPGYYDERAAAFDAETERALRHGDLDALLAISPALARELLATGRPAWQVMAGAIRQRAGASAAAAAVPEGRRFPPWLQAGRAQRGLGAEGLAADILYSDAPFGVGYLVAFLGVALLSVTLLRRSQPPPFVPLINSRTSATLLYLSLAATSGAPLGMKRAFSTSTRKRSKIGNFP